MSNSAAVKISTAFATVEMSVASNTGKEDINNLTKFASKLHSEKENEAVKKQKELEHERRFKA